MAPRQVLPTTTILDVNNSIGYSTHVIGLCLPSAGRSSEPATALTSSTGRREYGGGSFTAQSALEGTPQAGNKSITCPAQQNDVQSGMLLSSIRSLSMGPSESGRVTPDPDNTGDLDASPTDCVTSGGNDSPHPWRRSRVRDNINPPFRPRPPRSPKNTRAALRVATLNIRGFRHAGSPRTETKWNHVNQVIRDKKIGVLLVQETHLDDTRKANIEKIFGKRMKILHSMDPENPTGKGGVAVVLNKNLINSHNSDSIEIIPGRAILVSVNWHKEECIKILCIYAPNVTESDGGDSKAFWMDLCQYFVNNPSSQVDIVAGDFNIVEDAIDQLPARTDPEQATEALDRLKQILYVSDAWRNTFPAERSFTFTQDATSSMSRIDRFYMTDLVAVSARDWNVSPSGIPGTDHQMLSVQVAHTNAPTIGRGRWTLKDHIIRDKKFRAFVISTGVLALEKMNSAIRDRTPDNNPQIIYEKWKNGILHMAKEREKAIVPRYLLERRILELERDQLLKHSDLDDYEKRQLLNKNIKDLEVLEQKYHMERRDKISVKNRLEGETMCKYWTRSNKQTNPRDIIYALKKCDQGANEPTYENNSLRMAELAKDYHNNLQHKVRDIPDDIREGKIKKVLSAITTRTSDSQKNELNEVISSNEILKALREANNSSAPGPDGIPYVFWKSMNSQFINDSKLNQNGGTQRPLCNVIELLKRLYEDIQNFGIVCNSSFSEGWMCPLYKKNERSDIANYRPITCLNTDYKVFTKALATRLANVVPDLIHPSQAGFIPGRSITDQTKLIRMMIHFAEAKEQNGLIVALDQEKAYDKIDHQYLWRTLETFQIPPYFINTVKSLYATAKTRIMINGEMSLPWQIIRGVRQGDPLSCLLFDLAIEPLAASLRKSELKGYSIPGQVEKLIATLFADDTTTFLSIEDDFGALNKILDDWCIASKANFNISKTEVIPIGSPEFRESVIRNRCTKPGGSTIPDNIHIVEEGTSIRILGAWFGNKADASAPWTSVLEKIDKSLAAWEKSNPTMEGRRLIAQMVIAGMTQYLTQVQGMPANVERLLTRRAVRFMWAGKCSLVNEQTLFKPLGAGGWALVDIKSRNKAIDIMWLKSYLKFGPDCPTWAYLADALMAINPPKSDEKVDTRIKVNPFLQSWKTKVSSREVICSDIYSLFKTANEFNVRPEGLAFSCNVMRKIPIWYHFAADSRIRHMNKGRTINCLKENHRIISVGDTESLAKALSATVHTALDECECRDCMEIENRYGCMHPHSCVMKANELLSMLPSKWNPVAPQPDDRLDHPIALPPSGDGLSPTTFNARLAMPGSLADIFRIFTAGPQYLEVFSPPPPDEPPNEITVCLGSAKGCPDNEGGSQRIGSGLGLSGNEALHLGGSWMIDSDSSNSTGELLAVLFASMSMGTRSPMTIQTRSSGTIASLTKQLEKCENSGFLDVKNAGILRIVVGRLRMHAAPIIFQNIDDSSPTVTESLALSRAKEAVNNVRPLILPPIPTELHLTGAMLSKVTQASAYKAIRCQISTPARPRTVKMMSEIVQSIKESNHVSPSENQVWASFRSVDFARPLRVFLWKCAHDAYRVGMYWDKPNMRDDLKDRVNCKHDRELDSMNHILTECTCPGQATVWNLAGDIWKRKAGSPLSKQSLSSILASALTVKCDGNGRPSQGLTRLYRLLVTEAASLIWHLRCERIIQNEDHPHSEIEITNRWNKRILSRAELDFKLTNKRLGKKAIPLPIVLATWGDTEVIVISKAQGQCRPSPGGVLVGSRSINRIGVG